MYKRKKKIPKSANLEDCVITREKRGNKKLSRRDMTVENISELGPGNLTDFRREQKGKRTIRRLARKIGKNASIK